MRKKVTESKVSTLLMTAEQMQEADLFAINALDISGTLLMQRAGQGVAEAVYECLQDGVAQQPVMIVAGCGNNGGDGIAAAHILYQQGLDVCLLLVGRLDELEGDTAHFSRLVQKTEIEMLQVEKKSFDLFQLYLKKSGLIVDALFGTGLKRRLQGFMDDVVVEMNAAQAPKLAVDIASGIHSDSGLVMGVAVNADFTLPLAACKWGHWLADGPDYAGVLFAPVDIGIADDLMRNMQAEHGGKPDQAELISQADVAHAFPPRARQSHKNMFGHVWVFGGSIGFTGAPLLAADGAMAVGAGLVSIACPRNIHTILASATIEVMVHPQKEAPWQQATTVVAGPGWRASHQRELLEFLMSDVALLLDADALTTLAGSSKLESFLYKRDHLTVLTPHPGEAARLLGMTSKKVQADRLGSALALAEKYVCWVVLKGAETLVVSPDGQVWLNPFGSPYLARAGTGDVLAGMIGGMLAQGLQASIALPAAVALHGQAGEGNDWYRAGQLPERVVRLLARDVV